MDNFYSTWQDAHAAAQGNPRSTRHSDSSSDYQSSGMTRYNFNFCCMEELQPDGTWWHPSARFFALYEGAQFAPWDTDLRRDFEQPA